ncbi:MAG: hypothetical protein HS124_06780 [Anaerolineales bacterium]|nr:hypothetical protein [Anaerolineales bacterium]
MFRKRELESYSQNGANKACSGWWGFCGFDKHFSGFGLFLLSGIFPARPTTTNANRWTAVILH